jgi:hypothetical protein
VDTPDERLSIAPLSSQVPPSFLLVLWDNRSQRLECAPRASKNKNKTLTYITEYTKAYSRGTTYAV